MNPWETMTCGVRYAQTRPSRASMAGGYSLPHPPPKTKGARYARTCELTLALIGRALSAPPKPTPPKSKTLSSGPGLVGLLRHQAKRGARWGLRRSGSENRVKDFHELVSSRLRSGRNSPLATASGIKNEYRPSMLIFSCCNGDRR